MQSFQWLVVTTLFYTKIRLLVRVYYSQTSVCFSVYRIAAILNEVKNQGNLSHLDKVRAFNRARVDSTTEQINNQLRDYNSIFNLHV